MKFKFAIFVLSFLVSTYSFAQDDSGKQMVEHYIDQARALMARGDYEGANLKFRQILSTREVIPTDMCYYFAETLYMINQYQNSKNFIDKYYELTGETGDYYFEVAQLEQLVDAKIEHIHNCNFCNHFGYRLRPCNVCGQTGKLSSTCYYCQGLGSAVCTKCKGEGVLITVSTLGSREYHTCDRCDGTGKQSCPICHGEKVITDYCNTCRGTGIRTSDEVCDHTPEESLVAPGVLEN